MVGLDTHAKVDVEQPALAGVSRLTNTSQLAFMRVV